MPHAANQKVSPVTMVIAIPNTDERGRYGIRIFLAHLLDAAQLAAFLHMNGWRVQLETGVDLHNLVRTAGEKDLAVKLVGAFDAWCKVACTQEG